MTMEAVTAFLMELVAMTGAITLLAMFFVVLFDAIGCCPEGGPRGWFTFFLEHACLLYPGGYFYHCGYYPLRMFLAALFTLLIAFSIAPAVLLNVMWAVPVTVALLVAAYLLTCIGVFWWLITGTCYMIRNPQLALLE